MVSELGACWSHIVHRCMPVSDVLSHRSILDVPGRFEFSHRRARDGASGLAARESIQCISHRFPVCENRSKRDTDLRISRSTFHFATFYGICLYSGMAEVWRLERKVDFLHLAEVEDQGCRFSQLVVTQLSGWQLHSSSPSSPSPRPIRYLIS